MQESFTPLFSCLDSISLRPSQVGFAITETHHHSLGFPYFNNSARLVDRVVTKSPCAKAYFPLKHLTS